MADPFDFVQLLVTVAVARLSDGIAFLHGSRMMRITGDAAQLGEVAGLLTAGTTVTALRERVPPEVLDPVLGSLRDQGWLTDDDIRRRDAGTSWERQVGYLSLFGPDPGALQDRLRRSQVAILGVGGIGAAVAQHLVASGIGGLVLVDHDTVATHNLNRQYLYGTDAVGTPKVDAAAAGLARLSPETTFQPVRRAVTRLEDLQDLPHDLDLLVLAADTPISIADICWQWASATGTPMTAAAVGLTSGYWGPLLAPALGHCWTCWNKARLDGMTEVERQVEAALQAPTPYSFGPFNSAIAALAAFDVTRFLATGTCLSLERRGILNVGDGRLSVFEPRPGGRCADHAGVVEQAAGG